MKQVNQKSMKETQQTRNDLAKLFTGRGAEIGVERAAFSVVIAQYCEHLILVDPWTAYQGYREHVSQDKLDRFMDEALKKMEGKNFSVMRQFSLDAAMITPDESLDFVYIDANHSYENVRNDIAVWSKKVKKGGIVSGHDYIKRKGQDHIFGVVPAVKELNEEITIWRGDKSPSWSYIKQ